MLKIRCAYAPAAHVPFTSPEEPCVLSPAAARHLINVWGDVSLGVPQQALVKAKSARGGSPPRRHTSAGGAPNSAGSVGHGDTDYIGSSDTYGKVQSHSPQSGRSHGDDVRQTDTRYAHTDPLMPSNAVAPSLPFDVLPSFPVAFPSPTSKSSPRMASPPNTDRNSQNMSVPSIAFPSPGRKASPPSSYAPHADAHDPNNNAFLERVPNMTQARPWISPRTGTASHNTTSSSTPPSSTRPWTPSQTDYSNRKDLGSGPPSPTTRTSPRLSFSAMETKTPRNREDTTDSVIRHNGAGPKTPRFGAAPSGHDAHKVLAAGSQSPSTSTGSYSSPLKMRASPVQQRGQWSPGSPSMREGYPTPRGGLPTWPPTPKNVQPDSPNSHSNSKTMGAPRGHDLASSPSAISTRGNVQVPQVLSVKQQQQQPAMSDSVLTGWATQQRDNLSPPASPSASRLSLAHSSLPASLISAPQPASPSHMGPQGDSCFVMRTPKAEDGHTDKDGSLSPKSARKLWSDAERGMLSMSRNKAEGGLASTTPAHGQGPSSNSSTPVRLGSGGKKPGLVATMVNAKQAGILPFSEQDREVPNTAEKARKDDIRAEIARARELFEKEEAQREQERLKALSDRGFRGFSPQRVTSMRSQVDAPVDKAAWVLKFGVQEARGLPSMVGRGLVYVAVSALSDLSKLPDWPTFAHSASCEFLPWAPWVWFLCLSFQSLE
jgi:hypothetical protein